MSKNIFFTLFALFPVLFYGQGKYTIHGEFPDNSLDGFYVQIARLYTPLQSGIQFIDSVVAVNGKFHYEGEISEEPFIACIRYGKGEINWPIKTTNFIMEPGNICVRITDWEKMGDVSGTPINEDYNAYMQQNRVADWNRQLWLAKRFAGFRNRTWTEDDEREYTSVMFLRTERKQEYMATMQFVEKNAQYPEIVRDLLFLHVPDERTQGDLQRILSKMPEAVRDTLYAQWDEMYKRIKEFQIEMDDLRASRSRLYIDFTGKTPDGTEMKLSKILSENKLVLLYFWGAWYAPCIKEVPVIAGIYEKYKGQDLAVIGISNDANELEWKTAIEKHDMKWLQLISIDGKDEIGKLYNVNSIPDILLIDGNGTIVSRGLRGNELVNRIDELMSIE